MCMATLIAAQFGPISVVSSLIEIGTNVNDVGEDGDIPLHIAAYNGHSSHCGL